ncbi:MAG: hypothetical protein QM687_08970 [Ferruginibacter sp.]
MKKAILFTVCSWAIALAGYAQTLRVPMPKGLQCNDIPTWPITHTKKSNSETTVKTSTTTAQPSTSKPVTALPALPIIKFWLIAEANNSKADD